MGTIPSHWFLQSDIEQREGRKRDRSFIMVIIGWMGEQLCGQRRIYHGADAVQDMLPQNMAPWHIEYFKLKAFEKWPMEDTLTFSPEASHKKSSRERCPPYEEVSLPPRWKVTERK